MNQYGQSLAPEDPPRSLQPAGGSRLPSLAVQIPQPPPRDEDVIDLRALWAVLMRRRWLIFSVVTLAAILALVASFVLTPIYRSTLLLQIETEGNRVVDYGSVMPEEATGYRANMDFYRTQYELLKSNTLARRVIDQLGLSTGVDADADASFFKDLSAMLSSWTSLMPGADLTDETRGALDAEQLSRAEEEDAFLEQLTIEPVRDSRLVRIHFDSPSPAEAADVVNAVATNFINLNLERRFDASSFAKRFLEEQLAQARATLEESERRFAAYAREREIVDTDKRLEITLDKLRQMNAQLSTAEGARIAVEAEYLGLSDGGGSSLAGVLESPLIQGLKERRGNLEAEYRDQLQVLKPNYPSMRQMKQQIDELDAQIKRETSAIAGGVKARYEARALEEAKLQQRIAELNEEALALQDRSTDFETLKREVDTNRELYDGLLQRVKEVGVAAGIGDNNISVVDPARVPLSAYKPSLKLNLAIAIALGGFIGVLAAFMLEALDDTVRGAEDAEGLVGAPVLSLIPKVSLRELGLRDEELGLLTFKDPKSPLAEAVRSLRTQLLFSTSEGAPNVLHFTSALPGEGKSTTATNTAIAFAQSGSKVLLIDCDLRNPSLHRSFSLPNASGLTNYLAGTATPLEISQPTMVTRLFTITSGPLPPNPVELLSSAKMVDLLSVAATRFDIVVIDGPPVIGLADALVLANLAKATVFVVNAETTRRRDIGGAVKRLRQANAPLLGAVLAKMGRAGKGYGYGYGYGYSYDYMYSYGRKPAEATLPQRTAA
jgi:polysaccharide biosynthesis transport protein